jgi:ABC-type sulfate transport system permease subunit
LSVQEKMEMGKYLNVIAKVFILVLGLCSLSLFFYLHCTPDVKEYIKKVDASNTTMGLKLTVLYGLTKLISLIIGLSIPSVVIFKSIKEGKNKENAL